MTDWTAVSSAETSWNAGTGQNTATSFTYDQSGIKYDLDYITYNGYYIAAETDWASTSVIETAWT